MLGKRTEGAGSHSGEQGSRCPWLCLVQRWDLLLSPSTTWLKVLGLDRVQERQLQAGSAPSPSQLCCSPQSFPQGSSHPKAQGPITLRNPTFQKDIERRGEMGVGREGTTPAEEEDSPQTAENGHLGS